MNDTLHRPPPLRGAERGSFAEKTVAERLPRIAGRVLMENQLPPSAEEAISALIEEMPYRPVRLLTDLDAPDLDGWNTAIAEVEGESWLEVPWFFAETYFYRRIVEAVDYFAARRDPPLDPFAYQKRRGLEVSASQIQAASLDLQTALDNGWNPQTFVHLLKADLWGNQADLSLWPADDQTHPVHAPEVADSHLLIDDAPAVARHVDRSSLPRRIDVIVDNAGLELIGDLVLADYLLTSGVAADVLLHVKLHPTFVSDAVQGDVVGTIAFLTGHTDAHTKGFGVRLADHMNKGALRVTTDAYWTSSLSGWEMPLDVREDLNESNLVIAKGDANYRRLLGDRHWPFDTPFSQIMSYFLAPLVALRTYKSEVASGLDARRTAQIAAEDPEWLINGRWGLIQAANCDHE